jgi:hypothetical protein
MRVAFYKFMPIEQIKRQIKHIPRVSIVFGVALAKTFSIVHRQLRQLQQSTFVGCSLYDPNSIVLPPLSGSGVSLPKPGNVEFLEQHLTFI